MTEGESKCGNTKSLIIPIDIMRLDRLYTCVPPEELFERLFGYMGKRRFVAFYHSGYNCWSNDGNLVAAGREWAFQAWLSHPMACGIMAMYNLDNHGGEHEHWLVLDRIRRRLYAGPWQMANHVVDEQQGLHSDMASPQFTFDDLEHGLLKTSPRKEMVGPTMTEIVQLYRRNLGQTRDLMEWMEQRTKKCAKK